MTNPSPSSKPGSPATQGWIRYRSVCYLTGRGLAFGVGDEGELLPVRRPVAGRIHETDRVEMPIARRRRQFLDNLSRLRIGEIEVDAEQIAAAEERDEFSVRAEGRRHIVIVAVL